MNPKLPQPKYEVKEYPFGLITFRHLINDSFTEPEWQYQMIKYGNKFAFFYPEEEIEKFEKERK